MCRTNSNGVGTTPISFGSWVEFREEACRGGERTQRLLVNRRDRVALTLSAAEADVCRRMTRGDTGHEDMVAKDMVATDMVATESAFLLELAEQGFLAGTLPPMTTRDGHLGGIRRFARTLDARTTRANRSMHVIHDRFAHRLFSRRAVAGQVLLAVAGLVAVLHLMQSGLSLHLRVPGADIPVVMTLSLIAVAVHESAHALVVVHHGRRVDAVGFRLHLGTPAFYVESIDALLLSRRQRVLQALAGSWAEWMVTSVVALWVWLAPTQVAIVLLVRFVILNSVTICSNLLPFVGLDGHLVFADLIGEPDLGEATQGSVGRLVGQLAAGQPVTRRNVCLAVYSTLNAMVATTLLLLAGLFWYSLFGGVIAALAGDGPLGWVVLVVVAAVIARPGAVAATGRISRSLASGRELASRLRFRAQWRWRVPAIQELRASVQEFAQLDDRALSVLAGRLVRRRIPRSGFLRVDPDGHSYVHRGWVELCDGRRGTGGTTVPNDEISRCRRRSVLISTGT